MAFSFRFRRPQYVLLSSFLTAYCGSAAIMIMPLLAKERLGAEPALLGMYGFLANLPYSVVSFNMGWIGRRAGLRGSLTIGYLSLIAANFLMRAATGKYFIFAPCLLWGLSAGLFWPAVEGANAEGQRPEQIKRGVSYFIVAWVSGNLFGFFSSGWLYGLSDTGLLPFDVSTALLLCLMALAFAPRVLEIAPWEAAPPEEHFTAPLERRRLFARLGLLANFGLFMGLSCVRILLPQYANAAGLTGARYGFLMTTSMIGYLLANAVLGRWHGWHYRGRFLVASQLAAAAALVWFSFATGYAALCVAQTILGAMAGLTYFSSIYYGMELNEDKREHGGYHEGVIALAMGAAPLLGGWLMAATGWDRSAFAAAAGFIVLSAGAQTVLVSKAGKKNIEYRISNNECRSEDERLGAEQPGCARHDHPWISVAFRPSAPGGFCHSFSRKYAAAAGRMRYSSPVSRACSWANSIRS